MSLLEMMLPHFLGQKADQSIFAALNMAFQRSVVRILMFLSSSTLFEAMLPEFTM